MSLAFFLVITNRHERKGPCATRKGRSVFGYLPPPATALRRYGATGGVVDTINLRT